MKSSPTIAILCLAILFCATSIIQCTHPAEEKSNPRILVSTDIGGTDPEDCILGGNWFSDRSEPERFLGVQQAARTVSKHREAFLEDWAERWDWLR